MDKDEMTRTLLSQYTDSYTKLKEGLAQFSENEIIANNFELTTIYKEDIDNTGCFDAYGAYVAIVLPSLVPMYKGGNKNLSGLVATKKTVMRNGKQMTTTVYVDPNDENKDKDKKTTSSQSSSHHVMASQLSFSDEDSESPSVVKSYKKLSGKVGQLSDSSMKCLTFSDSEGIKGIVYYEVSNSDIMIKSVASDSNVFNVFTRGFLILLGRAKKGKKSLSLSPDFKNSPLISKYNMTLDKNGRATISFDDIDKLLS